MCHRFSRKKKPDELMLPFSVEQSIEAVPCYNIAPSTKILTVVKDPTTAKNIFALYKWGFVPSFARDPFFAGKMANARSETLHEKKSYKAAFKTQRCIIIVDGFYEWTSEGRAKIPHYFRMKSGEAFGIAGLYDTWIFPRGSMKGQELHTCTLITTTPNSIVAPVHERMPAILNPVDYEQWLDGSTYDEKQLLAMLKPYPAEMMDVCTVSTYVNNPKNQGEKCIEAVDK